MTYIEHHYGVKDLFHTIILTTALSEGKLKEKINVLPPSAFHIFVFHFELLYFLSRVTYEQRSKLGGEINFYRSDGNTA